MSTTILAEREVVFLVSLASRAPDGCRSLRELRTGPRSSADCYTSATPRSIRGARRDANRAPRTTLDRAAALRARADRLRRRGDPNRGFLSRCEDTRPAQRGDPDVQSLRLGSDSIEPRVPRARRAAYRSRFRGPPLRLSRRRQFERCRRRSWALARLARRHSGGGGRALDAERAAATRLHRRPPRRDARGGRRR